MKVFDVVCFFQELDLLEFRLKYYDEIVDYHVVIESNLTHSGEPKEYLYEINKERYSKWQNKIIYIQLEQSTEGLSFDKVDRYTPSNGSWILENQQRNSADFIKFKVNDDDVVMVNDLDEFVSTDILTHIKQHGLEKPVSVSQLFHYYYMNCQNIGHERMWRGTVLVPGSDFKSKDTQVFRDNRNHYDYIELGGYHFSFLNGIEAIRSKIKSFAHTEFNVPELTSDEHIIKCLEEGNDIFNRPGVKYKFVSLDDYPKNLRNLMLHYPQFIKTL